MKTDLFVRASMRIYGQKVELVIQIQKKFYCQIETIERNCGNSETGQIEGRHNHNVTEKEIIFSLHYSQTTMNQ